MKPTGFILYEGASLLDGAPIVAIAITGKSRNRKTGAMLQTYIMRSDAHPIDAVKSGADASVCGDCKHRPSLGGACYVDVGRGAASVYGAFMRGRYPRAADADTRPALATELVRTLGAQCSPMGGTQGYVIGPDVTGRLCHCATCSSMGAAQKLAQSLNDVWSIK